MTCCKCLSVLALSFLRPLSPKLFLSGLFQSSGAQNQQVTQAEALGSCPTLRSDITQFSKVTRGGGGHYQADLRAADFLWTLSVQSVSSSPTAGMRVLHHCEVVMNRRPTKRRRVGVGGLSPLPFYRSISSWKSPHLL